MAPTGRVGDEVSGVVELPRGMTPDSNSE